MAVDPTDETIGELQDLLLECLLTGRRLPGRDHPLRFPDLAYLTSGDATYVVTDHYHGHSSSVTARTEEELIGITGGMTGYARFTPIDQATWPLTLRLQVVVPFPDVEPLVVGEAIATFKPIGDRTEGGLWTTVEPTHVLAT